MGYRTYDCKVRKRCGACQLLNVPYELQLERKQNEVAKLFEAFPEATLLPIVGMSEPLHYRHKVLAPFAMTKKGRIVYGLYEEGTHQIVQADDCLVEDERAKPIMASIAALMPQFKITAYNEQMHRGLLRHVLIRTGYHTDEVLVTLVCTDTNIPGRAGFVKALRKKHPEISSIVLNINKRETNVVLGTHEQTLFGPGFIEDELCGCRFRLSSQSFYQTNPEQTEELYGRAIAHAQLQPGCTILDAYCGIGTIGIIAARAAMDAGIGANPGTGDEPDADAKVRLIGIEENREAVKNARGNARANRIENARFIEADATRALPEIDEPVDVLFMDPPRAGSTPQFLDAAIALAPARIVYISCNAATQVRDVQHLVDSGAYALESIEAVDMFPHTPHIECICTLVHR